MSSMSIHCGKFLLLLEKIHFSSDVDDTIQKLVNFFPLNMTDVDLQWSDSFVHLSDYIEPIYQ